MPVSFSGKGLDCSGMIVSRRLHVETRGHNHVIDLTTQVAQEVRESGLKVGTVTVFVIGSTAGITTIEDEPGLLADFQANLERLIPQSLEYAHHRCGGGNNAHSHLRASLWGCSLTIPFENGELLLGTWQQVVLVDFDTRPRSRQIVLHIAGE